MRRRPACDCPNDHRIAFVIQTKAMIGTWKEKHPSFCIQDGRCESLLLPPVICATPARCPLWKRAAHPRLIVDSAIIDYVIAIWWSDVSREMHFWSTRRLRKFASDPRTRIEFLEIWTRRQGSLHAGFMRSSERREQLVFFCASDARREIAYGGALWHWLAQEKWHKATAPKQTVLLCSELV
jgi:hypothetical protein